MAKAEKVPTEDFNVSLLMSKKEAKELYETLGNGSTSYSVYKELKRVLASKGIS